MERPVDWRAQPSDAIVSSVMADTSVREPHSTIDGAIAEAYAFVVEDFRRLWRVLPREDARDVVQDTGRRLAEQGQTLAGLERGSLKSYAYWALRSALADYFQTLKLERERANLLALHPDGLVAEPGRLPEWHVDYGRALEKVFADLRPDADDSIAVVERKREHARVARGVILGASLPELGGPSYARTKTVRKHVLVVLQKHFRGLIAITLVVVSAPRRALAAARRASPMQTTFAVAALGAFAAISFLIARHANKAPSSARHTERASGFDVANSRVADTHGTTSPPLMLAPHSLAQRPARSVQTEAEAVLREALFTPSLQLETYFGTHVSYGEVDVVDEGANGLTVWRSSERGPEAHGVCYWHANDREFVLGCSETLDSVGKPAVNGREEEIVVGVVHDVRCGVGSGDSWSRPTTTGIEYGGARAAYIGELGRHAPCTLRQTIREPQHEVLDIDVRAIRSHLCDGVRDVACDPSWKLELSSMPEDIHFSPEFVWYERDPSAD